MNSCPEDEPMTPSEECVDATTDETLLETNPIQSPLQVFAGMGGLALIAERLPMLYPDVIQQVTPKTYAKNWQMHGHRSIQSCSVMYLQQTHYQYIYNVH